MRAACFLSLLTLFLWAGNGHAEEACFDQFYPYTGVHTPAELATFLATSQDSVIVHLDEATKASLVARMVFINDYPAGMEGVDAQIQHLYDTNAPEVFAAIFAMPTLFHAYEDGPVLVPISIADLYALHPDFVALSSWCYNCCWPLPSEKCCTVGCHGCRDSIASDGNVFFAVSAGPLPVHPQAWGRIKAMMR